MDILRARGYPPGYPSLYVLPRGRPPMSRCPMALPSFFSEYLSRYTRGQGSSWSPLRGSGAREGASWRRWPPEYGKGNSVYRRLAHGCARDVWLRRMAYLQAKPELSAGRRDSTVVRAHARGGRALKQGAGSCPRAQPGRPQHPDPQPGGSTGPPPVSAPDGRPAPRQYPGLGLGRGLDRRAPALPDRRPGL